MNLKQGLQIGEKVEVNLIDNTSGKEKRCYSMIQEIPEADEALITMPMAQGHLVLFQFGDMIKVSFFRTSGQFSFVARVIDRFKSGNMILVRIKQISSIQRLQRRSFFRLKVTLPVLFRILDEGDSGAKGPYLKGYTIDISGGGMRMITDEQLKENMAIECKVLLEDDEEDELILKGKVVRVEKSDDNDLKYDMGVCFIKTPDKIKDRIVRYIFKQQRKLRQKGLI